MPPSYPPASEPRAGDASARAEAGPAAFDGADTAYSAVFAFLSVWSWVGLVLAEAGRFSPVWLVGLALPVSAAAAAWVWRLLTPVAAPATAARAIAGVLAVAAIASYLAARPGEFLVDGSDGSVYLAIGGGLARHHALVHPEPLLDVMSPDDWASVFSRERHPPRVFNLFPGGIQVLPGVNAVQPNFFHLLPVWLGIADTAGGPKAMHFVSPLVGVVAIVAFWLLVRALTSALVATAASVLLLANLAQMWFARAPMTEIMAQAFIVSGVYFAVRCYQRPAIALGVLCATAFGLAAFVRIDVLMLVTPLAIGFLAVVALERRWSRPWTWCALVLFLVTAHAIAHAAIVSTPYTERILFHAFSGRSVTSASRILPPLVLAVGALALLLARRFRGSRLVRLVGPLVFLAILGAAVYRIWPQVTGGFLLMLMSPLGVGLAVAGAVIWMVEDRSAPTLLVVGLLLASALVYGESVRDRSTMPMLLRRFVPVILPLSVLCIGVLFDRAWRHHPASRILASVACVALCGTWVTHSRPLIAAAPMTGVHDQLARFVAALPDDAIVVTDQTTPSHLGLSLRGTFGRDVLWVHPTPETSGALERLARRTSRPLAIVRGPSAASADVLSARELAAFTLSPPRVETLQMTQLEPTLDRLPSAIVARAATIEFYIAHPRDPAMVPVTVEIGAGDLSARLDGFHDAEQMGEASARWTREHALIQLPLVRLAGHGALVLRLAAPRAAGMAAPQVRVSLDGVEVGTTAELAAGFQLVELPLPDRSLTRLAAGPSVLTLSVATFVPAEHGMGGDTRPLGAIVDWVRVDAR